MTNNSNSGTKGGGPFYAYATADLSLYAFLTLDVEWRSKVGEGIGKIIGNGSTLEGVSDIISGVDSGDIFNGLSVELKEFGLILRGNANAGFGWSWSIPLPPFGYPYVTVVIGVDAAFNAEISVTATKNGVYRWLAGSEEPLELLRFKGKANGLVRLRGALGVDFIAFAAELGLYGELRGDADLTLRLIKNQQKLADQENINCKNCEKIIDLNEAEKYIICPICGQRQHEKCWNLNKGCKQIEGDVDCIQVFEGWVQAGWGVGFDTVWRLGPPIHFRIVDYTVAMTVPPAIAQIKYVMTAESVQTA